MIGYIIQIYQAITIGKTMTAKQTLKKLEQASNLTDKLFGMLMKLNRQDLARETAYIENQILEQSMAVKKTLRKEA